MKHILPLLAFCLLLISCTNSRQEEKTAASHKGKVVIYQVFTRLFGNTNSHNIPWGTLEENGVGKFEDFDDVALQSIHDLGVTHIWYTGVLHHAMVTDYSGYGIPGDDPDVVKGRAGSPYSIKDYYNVNPDLARDPSKRMEEFEKLIDRSHAHGIKVIIDIVPNHVARNYNSHNKPAGVRDLGAGDDSSVEYARDNNFYYVPGQAFSVPEWREGYRVLGGEEHPLSDGLYMENPARWTANGSREPQPDMHDWYEAIKINFGIKPDGSKDFTELPGAFSEKDYPAHHAFWQDKEVPNSWIKFREIALFWMDKGVDGFRYDMAEMVPVEFWSYMNSAIKMENPDAFLLAEIYNPSIYRDYINIGKMDYLYDKVQLYDSLKHIMQGHGSTDAIALVQKELADIEHHMLHFLENHDEQRIASPGFAGDARKGKPAMVVSTCLGSSPTMIYFGQHLGEPGAEDAGFGKPSRTSIFDYIGVPLHQAWMNGGSFNGALLDKKALELHQFYTTLLNFSKESSALTGSYFDLHTANRIGNPDYNEKLFAFARWKEKDRLLIISNFDDASRYEFELLVPEELLSEWGLEDASLRLSDQLSNREFQFIISEGKAIVPLSLSPLESLVLKLN